MADAATHPEGYNWNAFPFDRDAPGTPDDPVAQLTTSENGYKASIVFDKTDAMVGPQADISIRCSKQEFSADGKPTNLFMDTKNVRVLKPCQRIDVYTPLYDFDNDYAFDKEYENDSTGIKSSIYHGTDQTWAGNRVRSYSFGSVTVTPKSGAYMLKIDPTSSARSPYIRISEPSLFHVEFDAYCFTSWKTINVGFGFITENNKYFLGKDEGTSSTMTEVTLDKSTTWQHVSRNIPVSVTNAFAAYFKIAVGPESAYPVLIDNVKILSRVDPSGTYVDAGDTDTTLTVMLNPVDTNDSFNLIEGYPSNIQGPAFNADYFSASYNRYAFESPDISIDSAPINHIPTEDDLKDGSVPFYIRASHAPSKPKPNSISPSPASKFFKVNRSAATKITPMFTEIAIEMDFDKKCYLPFIIDGHPNNTKLELVPSGGFAEDHYPIYADSDKSMYGVPGLKIGNRGQSYDGEIVGSIRAKMPYFSDLISDPINVYLSKHPTPFAIGWLEGQDLTYSSDNGGTFTNKSYLYVVNPPSMGYPAFTANNFNVASPVDPNGAVLYNTYELNDDATVSVYTINLTTTNPSGNETVTFVWEDHAQLPILSATKNVYFSK